MPPAVHACCGRYIFCELRLPDYTCWPDALGVLPKAGIPLQKSRYRNLTAVQVTQATFGSFFAELNFKSTAGVGDTARHSWGIEFKDHVPSSIHADQATGIHR